MDLIRPAKQSVWKWPAVVNFSLGGMGTGLYLLGLLFAPQSHPPLLSALVKLPGPLLVALGFLALTTEAGRPLRGYNLFRHLRRSWMSRETLAAALFIPAAFADWLFPHPILRGLAAIAALALMISQGFIVYRARGVTAWNVPLVPLIFLSSGFATGAGVLLVILGVSRELFAGDAVLLGGLIALTLNLGGWLLYLRRSDPPFRAATRTLRNSGALVVVVGLGHLLPAALLLAAAASRDAGTRAPIVMIAGLLLVLGGVSQKIGLILEAGYLRAIALTIPRFPAAGP